MLWIWGILILAGILFVAKMVYVVTTALALPATQGALFVSTSSARIKAFLDAVPMKPEQTLLDLGCGDGRVLACAVDRYGVRAVGYELNLLAYLRAWFRCFGRKNLKVVRKNFWHADLSGADVVFCYLFPDVMGRLVRKVRKEAKPGSVLVSCNFPVKGLVPERVLRPKGALHHDPIFIYRF